MARGLGAIIAEIQMAETARRISAGEVLQCPLCGGPMENDGAGWFCYNQKPANVCPELEALIDAFYENAPPEIKADGGVEPHQGQIIAAIVEPGNPPRLLAELRTVRGPGGKTNLRAGRSLDAWNEVDDADLPELVQRYDWTWMEWTQRG